MKKIIAFLILVSLNSLVFSQDVGLLMKSFISSNKTKGDLSFPQRYSIKNLNNEDYLSVILKTDKKVFDKESIEKLGCIIRSDIGGILSVNVPVDMVEKLQNIKGIIAMEASKKIGGVFLDKATSDVSSDLVWQGYSLAQGYSGKDVLIGVTDWGFDYTHPMFYDTSMVNYRIFAAWDQFATRGPAPQGFNYGTLYNTKQDLLSAQCDTFNIYNHAYHGSHVAGIAAGGGAGTKYRGVAYDANLLFATFLIEEAAVLDAYVWMRDVAKQEGKRLVINGSWGLYHFGAMDGTSLFDQAIDSLSLNDSIVFVTSAGNNGTEKFHLLAEFDNNDTVTSVIGFDKLNSNADYWGESITMTGDSTDRFSSCLEVYNNLGELLFRTSWVNTLDEDFILDTVVFVGGDSVFYRANSKTTSLIQARPSTQWEVRNNNVRTTNNYIVLSIISPTGKVHCWNVAELTTGVGNWGLDFLRYNAKDVGGDSNYGIGEPAVCKSAISVGAYLSQPRGTYIGGTRSSFSSIGPTIDGRLKPEISAPGQGMYSSISSFATDDFSSYNLVNFEGRDYPFAPLSGTSMSSPMVTGIVALMLEANRTLTPEKIKEIIIETARKDNYTTENLPNYLWGYGKISAIDAVKNAEILISLDKEAEKNCDIKVFPNPTTDYLNIESGDIIDYMRITDALSRVVMEKSMKTTSQEIDISSLEKGIYVLSLKRGDRLYNYKIVKR
ncbi:MAG: S8 family peptidase [Bacteroidales bacterium]|jgi:subtilisin family serine protease|nr:S8 family peptidase [Bacteroidales bacterium]